MGKMIFVSSPVAGDSGLDRGENASGPGSVVSIKLGVGVDVELDEEFDDEFDVELGTGLGVNIAVTAGVGDGVTGGAGEGVTVGCAVCADGCVGRGSVVGVVVERGTILPRTAHSMV